MWLPLLDFLFAATTDAMVDIPLQSLTAHETTFLMNNDNDNANDNADNDNISIITKRINEKKVRIWNIINFNRYILKSGAKELDNVLKEAKYCNEKIKLSFLQKQEQQQQNQEEQMDNNSHRRSNNSGTAATASSKRKRE